MFPCFILGMLAHSARVHDGDIGIRERFRRQKPARLQRQCHFLRIGGVHLAAVARVRLW